MKKTNSIIEKLKSAVIVVLFSTSILLLCFFWADVSLSDISLPEFAFEDDTQMQRSFYAEDVAIPSDIILCFGDEEYTIIKESKDIFFGSAQNGGQGFLDDLRNFLAAENVFAESISDEQYNEVFTYRSVRAEFGYYMPYRDFCAHYGLQTGSVGRELRGLSEIGFSEAAPNNLFICDRNSGKFYRIISENQTDCVDKLLANAQTADLIYYYPLGAFLGEELATELKVPLYMESRLSELEAGHEFLSGDAEKIGEEAQGFFGSTFDFVRKIEESSGRTLYMYGYANMVLIADVDGSIEYKMDINESSDDGYFGALEKALRFIDGHAELKSLLGEDAGLRLTVADERPSGKNGYRFEFEATYNGAEIFEDTAAISIEVCGDTVRYFRKKLPVLEGGYAEEEAREAFSAVNALAANYQYISDKLDASVRGDRRRPISFEELSALVRGMDYGYIWREDALVPVWRVSVDGVALPVYFDLYTAEPLE